MRRARGCQVVLFHSVLGLRPSVRQWADELRAAGHTVHTPDLSDGQVFDDYTEAMRYVQSIGGIPAIMARTNAAVAELPQDLVYAGFSNGAVSAEYLAGTRPHARGAILMHGAVPLAMLNSAEWPAGVPVQVHYMTGDPFREQAHLTAFAEAVRRSGAPLTLYDYPGTGHLFGDADLPEYDVSAAELMLDRVLDALDRLRYSRNPPHEQHGP